MQDRVQEKLNRVKSLIDGQIETYLKLCESPIEKMFLLSYFESIFDSMTASWFSFGFEEKEPYFQYPDQDFDGKYFPSGIKWFEPNNMRARKSIKPHLIELYPQYQIKDEQGKLKYRLDFAILYPRTDEGDNKIQIAIECDGHEYHEKTKEQAQRDKQKDRYLQSKGWIVARFTGSEVYKADVYDLIHEIDTLAMNKDYEIFQEIERVKNKWRIDKDSDAGI